MSSRTPAPVAQMIRRIETDAQMPVVTVGQVALPKAASIAEALRIGNALFKATRSVRADSIVSTEMDGTSLAVLTRGISLRIRPMIVSESHLMLTCDAADAGWSTPIHVDAGTKAAVERFYQIGTQAESGRVGAAIIRAAGRAAFAAALSAEDPAKTRRAHAAQRADRAMHEGALSCFEATHPEFAGRCSLTVATWNDVRSFEVYVEKTHEVFTAPVPTPPEGPSLYRHLMVQVSGAPATAHLSTPDGSTSIDPRTVDPVSLARTLRDPLHSGLVWSFV